MLIVIFKNDNQQFLQAIRNFAAYFESKDLSSINDKTFTNGYLSKNKSDNNESYNFLKNQTFFEKTLTASTFLQFSLDVYNTFTSDDEYFKEFHLQKENVVVVRFLYKLMSFKGEIA